MVQEFTKYFDDNFLTLGISFISISPNSECKYSCFTFSSFLISFFLIFSWDFVETNSFISLSDYEDCESNLSKEDRGPVSSHSNNLKRRFKINLDRMKIFTALAGDKTTQTFLNSPLFRFIHTIDGRAANGNSDF